jgi:hypothetical protein
MTAPEAVTTSGAAIGTTPRSQPPGGVASLLGRQVEPPSIVSHIAGPCPHGLTIQPVVALTKVAARKPTH